MNFNSDSISQFGQSSFDKVPADQLNQLLRRRTKPQDSELFLDEYQNDVKTLETYCKSRGIMAMNLGHMDPKVALQFLRNQLGDTTPMLKESKRGLLNG